MRYEYYIVALPEGVIYGTNSDKVAREKAAQQGQYAVIDTLANTQMLSEHEVDTIPEAK